VVGARDAILRSLEAFGFEWDGPITFQSDRAERYHAALDRLRAAGLLFDCACSRREIARRARPSVHGGYVYPGTCRAGPPKGRRGATLRLRVETPAVSIADQIQGACVQDLEGEVGDFVVRRADGLFAYQLAVVVDDAEQGITEVVRGSDLLDSTPRQVFLQRVLGLARPSYAHVPVIVDGRGRKLSKQTRAQPLDDGNPSPALAAALAALGLRPSTDVCRGPVRDLWQWALERWTLAAVPRARSLPSR
jgi:glutamyl-Q tRNA(Asp) synthetase